MNPRRFRIAFSFAGEKRDFVAKVAEILAAQFTRDAILYDKFHEAEFARYDLGIFLPRLYREQSDLIVPVLCPNYDPKKWTGWEWVHIYGLLTKEDGHRVMPSRFEKAKVEGLGDAAAFIELDKKKPEEFAGLILQRLARNEGRPADHYTKPGASSGTAPHTSILNNLPCLQPFFGRKEELARIAAALDPEDRTWGALIDGPGGMGKTSLAVRAAYDVSPALFDKIVFVSLKGRELDDDGVRDLSGFLISGLSELFNELARELGCGEITKAAEEERPRLVQQALRGTKTLLILDNLESLTRVERDRLFTFVRRLPRGCKAILTARGRIGSGAEELNLEELGQDAALDILAELATHIPHVARTSDSDRIALIKATQGQPLLLRWTAGQLGRGHCLTVKDALGFLRSCPKGNDPLEFIFGDLVEDFRLEETRALCALAHFTLPATVEHIAELAQCSIDQADHALRCLSVRSLAVASNESRTFTLVPLVADFLQTKKPGDIAEMSQRLEALVYRFVVDNGYNNYDRFDKIGANWPIVAAALPLFLLGSDERLQTVCHALENYLNFRGQWDEWLSLSLVAETKAAEASHFMKAGWRAHNAAYVYYLRGQATDALEWVARADKHWKKLPSSQREAGFVLQLRGLVLEAGHDYAGALAAYQEAIRIWREYSPVSLEVAVGLSSQASIERWTQDFSAAEEHFKDALKIARDVGYEEGIASYTGKLADIAICQEDWKNAETLARDALELSKRLGRQELIASNFCRLAQALIHQRRIEEARTSVCSAIQIFTELKSPQLEGAKKLLADCT